MGYFIGIVIGVFLIMIFEILSCLKKILKEIQESEK